LKTPNAHQRASPTHGEARLPRGAIEKGRGTFHLAASGSKLIAYELSRPPVLQEYTSLYTQGESKNLINLRNIDTVTPLHQLSPRNSGVFTPKILEV
jgi:hypothetical protein